MDPSFSNINEVYYDGPLTDDTQITNDPLSPNYYQDQPYQQNSFTYMSQQQSAGNPAYHNYQILTENSRPYLGFQNCGCRFSDNLKNLKIKRLLDEN